MLDFHYFCPFGITARSIQTPTNCCTTCLHLTHGTAQQGQRAGRHRGEHLCSSQLENPTGSYTEVLLPAELCWPGGKQRNQAAFSTGWGSEWAAGSPAHTRSTPVPSALRVSTPLTSIALLSQNEATAPGGAQSFALKKYISARLHCISTTASAALVT